MNPLPKFLILIAITVASGVAAYFALQWISAGSVAVLIATFVAVLVQVAFALSWSKKEQTDRLEALKVAGRICNTEYSPEQNIPFSVLMKDLESLFRETLSRERKVVENAADVICIVSTDGTILRANAAAKPVLGYQPDDLVGKKLADYHIGGNTGDTMNPLLGAAESIQKIQMESQFKKKDGKIIDLLWSAHWSASDNGLFCVAHDITERKQAEERVRLILESLPAGVCVLGLLGQIQFVNNTARQICSIDDEQQWSRKAKSIFRPCPEPFTIDNFVSEKLSDSNAKVLSMTGEEIPVEISVRRIDWENEPACLVMFVDVSEKWAAEKAKQEFLAMRDESLAIRRRLMDMVVHDIRTPLASLLSAHELMLKGVGVTLEEKAKKKLEVCQEEVKRVVRLINDLLKISRHEATKLNLSLAEADIEKLIRQAVGSISDLAQEKHLKIEAETASQKVNVDSDRIIQVLVNLLSNATKFSPDNSVIKVSSTVQDDEYICVSVSDQGKGIPQGSETSIFLPYSQVSWKDSVEKGGTGLGLSICREIVEEHGGKIGVNNNAQGGAYFWFTLPLLPNA